LRLLLLEDDDILGEVLCLQLRAAGHRVDRCSSLAQTEALRGEPYDALLVDWMLPDGSGLEWLRSRRTRGDTTAAIVLSARETLDDRIQGLDGGGDDYLVKPFALDELAARLRAVSRRSAGSAASRLAFGRVVVDLQARAAFLDDSRAELTGREWALLEALVMRTGRIVAKADLEKLVLGFESEVASNAVEVHVSSLRRKLDRALIETVRGIGYRINAT
jgi:two-component system OmpR family response regulator